MIWPYSSGVQLVRGIYCWLSEQRLIFPFERSFESIKVTYSLTIFMGLCMV